MNGAPGGKAKVTPLAVEEHQNKSPHTAEKHTELPVRRSTNERLCKYSRFTRCLSVAWAACHTALKISHFCRE